MFVISRCVTSAWRQCWLEVAFAAAARDDVLTMCQAHMTKQRHKPLKVNTGVHFERANERHLPPSSLAVPTRAIIVIIIVSSSSSSSSRSESGTAGQSYTSYTT